MKKRFFALLLGCVLCLGFCCPAFAADDGGHWDFSNPSVGPQWVPNEQPSNPGTPSQPSNPGTSNPGGSSYDDYYPSTSPSSGNTTTTTTNPDGSTTTTVTNRSTGTVTETTKATDGSTTVVETKTDGTVTTTQTAPSGVKVTTVSAPGADVTASITIPASAGSTAVTIPSSAVTPGTVAVDAKTGEIIKLSVPTESGLAVRLNGSTDIILEDRSKDYVDADSHWAADSIDFVTAHGMFSGTSEDSFSPEAPMTRAMMMTVLARFDGVDTSGGSTWYEKGMEWSRSVGVSDGSTPNQQITREQLVTMLYRYVGNPAATGTLAGFPDADRVSDYAEAAMRWAVETGLVVGSNGWLNPQSSATRAEVAAILSRFCTNLTI